MNINTTDVRAAIMSLRDERAAGPLAWRNLSALPLAGENLSQLKLHGQRTRAAKAAAGGGQ